jgi:hypothetical protein
MLKLTVAFTDGRRSHWASADAAAGEVAGKIYSPYSVGMMGADGWEPLIERSQRDQGRRKNGSTMFTFTTFQGPSDAQRAAGRAERTAAEARYAASQAQYARR